ncbi:MAG: hypothetical protein COA79_12810 [Planctomycetota bacterium]|nr:MAG: hypothetical protein COA79_12810 [Planctomycetota bacterium]
MTNKNESIPNISLSLDGVTVLPAENALLNLQRSEIVNQSSFEEKKGVSLQRETTTNIGSLSTSADLTFKVKAIQSGRFEIHTHSATDKIGTKVMKEAKNKFESLFLMIAIGSSRPTRRVLFTPWSKSESCKETLGKFNFTGEDQEIKVWLPEGVRLDFLKINLFIPPVVPDAAYSYQPKVVPPDSHPRIWVNKETLPTVRSNLVKLENAPLWNNVQEMAMKPFSFEFKEDGEVDFNPELENAAITKAFVSLMIDDFKLGNEAIVLIRDYLNSVEFGNILDITREIGLALYSASLVYDWCYDLMSVEDRNSIKSNLLRIADDMEIGWPPFNQKIVNGHGNEAQVTRDLLCMSIAIYDEDPVPYQYCSYRLLEELAPMRKFEYQSPRHNQGNSYGPYRFGWDMHAATLFFRMSGEQGFDENITGIYKSWLYIQLPDDCSLKDGDDSYNSKIPHLGLTSLLSYSYAKDPLLKYEFERLGGLPNNPVLFLLLNDPELKGENNLASLPLTLDGGPILGSMITRTGWSTGLEESDVVVEIKGGGYHFGNHQHSDAGSFQIYYRGMQVVDLGQYLFYGTPYDFNFCKRSVSHSMMLVYDPDENFSRNVWNDGGTRFNQVNPTTPEQVCEDSTFANGTVLFSDFGPSSHTPSYNIFSVDLASAYSDKIKSYVRTFCFLNLESSSHPGVLIIFDNISTFKPEFKKYWQVNTFKEPEITEEGVILRNDDLGMSGKIRLEMLLPKAKERKLEILSGEEASTVFGKTFSPPLMEEPEASGHRVMFSPINENSNDVFLTVMSISPEDSCDLPTNHTELAEVHIITIANRVVVLNKTDELLNKVQKLEIKCEDENQYQLLLIGLEPGQWTLRNLSEDSLFNYQVVGNKNCAFFEIPCGVYTAQLE